MTRKSRNNNVESKSSSSSSKSSSSFLSFLSKEGGFSHYDYYLLEGEWRRPVNDLRQQHVGGGHMSVHDDATAKASGFTIGAPIHGTVHFTQLTPLLLKVYPAKDWFERGTISVTFTNVVTHLEPVKAFVGIPKQQKRQQQNQNQNNEISDVPPPLPPPPPLPKQVKVWMIHLDGRIVFQGTASLGLDVGETMIDQQLQRLKNKNNNKVNNKKIKDPGITNQQQQQQQETQQNLVFLPHPVGTKTTNVEHAKIEWGKIIGDLFPFTPEQKLQVITEWHPWYSREGCNIPNNNNNNNNHQEEQQTEMLFPPPSPWKRPILPLEGLNQIMLYTMPTAQWPPIPSSSRAALAVASHLQNKTPVALFGACEIKLHHGPVFVGESYSITRQLIAIGETPRTEFRWTKTWLRHSTTGILIAEMTLQDMMLKHTIPNYNELRSLLNKNNNNNENDNGNDNDNKNNANPIINTRSKL